jgi:hypothetical protein
MALAIPIAVTVETVVPAGMVISAVIVAVPPTSRLSLVRDEYAPEQKCDDRANDDLHGVILPIGN